MRREKEKAVSTKCKMLPYNYRIDVTGLCGTRKG